MGAELEQGSSLGGSGRAKFTRSMSIPIWSISWLPALALSLRLNGKESTSAETWSSGSLVISLLASADDYQ